MKQLAPFMVFLLMCGLIRIARAEEPASPTSSGTAFRVSRNGHLLTNYHVIDGCRSLTAYIPSDNFADSSTFAIHTAQRWFLGEQAIEARPETVKVLKTDPQNDLALLLPEKIEQQRVEKSRIAWFLAYARFREGQTIDLGENVTVIGFPLRGMLTKINVTDGKVSSLAGPGGSTQHMQITAPIQGGNSGGPVLDDRGNVIGVVVSSLDASWMLEQMGDIPQNVNFAIRGEVARQFVQSFLSTLEVASLSGEKKDTVAIARDAVQFTFPLHCYK